jgi:hypothetical protein
MLTTFGAMVLGFAWPSIIFAFNGGIDTADYIIQVIVIMASMALVRLCLVELTGATMNLPTTMLVWWQEMCYYPGYGFDRESWVARIAVTWKFLVILVGEILGWCLGYILYLAWASRTLTDMDFNTHNCTELFLTTNDTIAACITQPSFNSTAHTDGSAMSWVILGNLLSMGAFILAYILAKPRKVWTPMLMKFPKEKVEFNNNLVAPISFNGGNLSFAIISTTGDAMAHLIFFRYAGVVYNYYYWMVAGMFTNGYDQAKVYGWPGFVVGAVIFVIGGIMVWLFYTTTEARHKLVREDQRRIENDEVEEEAVELSD